MTAVFVLAVGLVATRAPILQVVAVTAGTVVAISLPFLVIPVALAGAGYSFGRRLRSRGAAERNRRADAARLAELTGIGLTGGLGLQPALALAAEALGGPVGAEAKAMLRQIRIGGAAAAASAKGAAIDLYRAIGRASQSGAPMSGQVRRIADQMHAELVASQLQALRRLPVLMLFPLTLLILPGFMLLTVAPALVDAFGRLDF